MNRRQLRYFVEIAASGGFAAASRKLYISQPALHYQMNELEAGLGVKLLDRHPQGADLTPAGATFLPAAQDLLSQYRKIEEVAAPFRRPAVSGIDMGFNPTSARIIAPDLVHAIERNSTAMKITVQEALSSALAGAVLAGELDCAFCYGSAESLNRIIPFYVEDLFLVGPDDRVRSDEGDIEFSQLGEYEFVVNSNIKGARRFLDDLLKDGNARLNIAVESDLVEISHQLVRTHRHCTIAPLGLYMDFLAADRLGARRIVNPAIQRVGGMMFRPGFPRKLQDILCSCIRDIIDARIGEGRLGWKAP